MFPADAGMNRRLKGRAHVLRHVPRRRGDEPLLNKVKPEKKECSPQTRG